MQSAITGDQLTKQQRNASYIFFYILFLPDTWRILIGLLAAIILVPAIATPKMDVLGRVVLYLMITAIGYAASSAPARGITRLLKNLILGGERKQ